MGHLHQLAQRELRALFDRAGHVLQPILGNGAGDEAAVNQVRLAEILGDPFVGPGRQRGADAQGRELMEALVLQRAEQPPPALALHKGGQTRPAGTCEVHPRGAGPVDVA
jgi:hypothetical protein